MKLLEYILVAEFDILKGNTITFQYPQPTNEDTQFLAEMMLPDGAHKREEDWTIFFLNRPCEEIGLPEKKRDKELGPPIEAFVYWFSEEKSDDGWALLDPNKKKIVFKKSGIEVKNKEKTLAQIKKHANLEYSQLDNLFFCISAEDGSAMGLRFSNKGDEDKFFSYMQAILSPEETEIKNDDPFLYCLNLVNNRKVNTATRGAIVKSLAFCSRFQYIHIFKPFMILGLQKFFENPSQEVLSELYSSINSINMNEIPSYPDHYKLILRNSNDRSKQEYSFMASYLTKINVRIPLTLFPDEIGDVKITNLVKKFGAQTITIFNALLAEKRILFLGFDCAAGEVCEYVLAACCMVCPPLKGFGKRAFPYTNLTYLDFLSVPGYIAGVTNPMFETHGEWWDFLCNINTGKVLISPAQQQSFEKHGLYDNEFMSKVNASISSHYGEESVRLLFKNYTQHIIDMAFDEEEFVDEISQQTEMDLNKGRLETWKKTLSFKIYQEDRKQRLESTLINDANVFRYIKKLKIQKNISETEMIRIYTCFLDNIKTEEELVEFLSYFPESSGGLNSIAVSLFHKSQAVRVATVQLIHRFDTIQTGNNFVNSLNLFFLIAYQRNIKAIELEKKEI